MTSEEQKRLENLSEKESLELMKAEQEYGGGQILPKYIGENIDRSKQRRKLIDEIIQDIKDLVTGDTIIEKLEKLKEIA